MTNCFFFLLCRRADGQSGVQFKLWSHYCTLKQLLPPLSFSHAHTHARTHTKHQKKIELLFLFFFSIIALTAFLVKKFGATGPFPWVSKPVIENQVLGYVCQQGFSLLCLYMRSHTHIRECAISFSDKVSDGQADDCDTSHFQPILVPLQRRATVSLGQRVPHLQVISETSLLSKFLSKYV